MPPPEQIARKETFPTDRANSNSGNDDPVFGLFSTQVFDPSDDSFEQILALSGRVGDEDSISV